VLLVVKLHGAILVDTKVQVNVLEFFVNQTHCEDLLRRGATNQNELCGFHLDASERELAQLQGEDHFKVVVHIEANQNSTVEPQQEMPIVVRSISCGRDLTGILDVRR